MLAALFMPAVLAADEGNSPTILSKLIVEKQRQQALAATLQNNIRRKTAEAARLVPGELLQRDVALAKTQLIALRAKRKATQEQTEQPVQIPAAILEQMNPEFVTLNTKRKALQERKETLIQLAVKPDDPQIQTIDQNIEALDERIRKFVDENSLERAMQVNDQVNLFTLDQEIRTQEILVLELGKRYKEQLKKSTEHAEYVAEISFDQAQLDRVNKIIEQIDARILALTSEQKDTVNLADTAPENLSNRALLLRILETLDRIEARLNAAQPAPQRGQSLETFKKTENLQ